MQRDLGSYDYVQRVYNENMRLAAYKLPQTAADGDVIFIDDGLIKLTMQIADGRVVKITIVATNPRSRFTCRFLKDSNSDLMQSAHGFKITRKRQARMAHREGS